MPRKKKKTVSQPKSKKDEKIIETLKGEVFQTSKYQQAIFDEIEHTSNNIVVEACAGAGKTTTIIKTLDLIPEDKRILFVAFNSDIVKDITAKAGTRDNVDIRTLHSLGYKILLKFLGNGGTSLDQYKYISFVQKHSPELSNHPVDKLSRKSYKAYTENILSLVNFGRFNLCQTEKDFEKICQIYSIDCMGDEIDVAIKVIEWGKEHMATIDFTDMIYLPVALDINNVWFKYDYVFLDESQDSNLCEFQLMQKCFKMGTRFIAVGDFNQSIYSFAGSSPEVMDKFKNLPNTVALPLSISYRCPKSVINFVKEKFPNISIEAMEDAPDGEITNGTHISDLKDGDSVLCRTNAPLMKVYVDLLKDKKEAYILGKDIGDNMIKAIKHFDVDVINQNMHSDGLFLQLYQDLFYTRDKIMRQAGIDKITASNSDEIVKKYDMIQCISILSDGINSVDVLINKIKSIFSDKDRKGIKLSTIHKAKGLTLDNVYVCCPSLIPSSRAVQKWEIDQEHNLEYVCYTRARKKLSFMSEEGFGSFLNGKKESIYNKLKPIEDIVIQKTGKRFFDYIPKASTANYKDIIKNAKKPKIEKTKTVTASSITAEKKKPSSILKRKNNKIKI